MRENVPAGVNVLAISPVSGSGSSPARRPLLCAGESDLLEPVSERCSGMSGSSPARRPWLCGGESDVLQPMFESGSARVRSARGGLCAWMG